MARVRRVALKVAEITRMIRFAEDSGVTLPEEWVTTFRGKRLKEQQKMAFVDGVWREKES
jgi:hypothetical protein